jgi:hypothetical protein
MPYIVSGRHEIAIESCSERLEAPHNKTLRMPPPVTTVSTKPNTQIPIYSMMGLAENAAGQSGSVVQQQGRL